MLMPQEEVEAAGLQMTGRRTSFLRDDERLLPLDQMRPTIGPSGSASTRASSPLAAREDEQKSSLQLRGEKTTDGR